jgi:hypothetical protein
MQARKQKPGGKISLSGNSPKKRRQCALAGQPVQETPPELLRHGFGEDLLAFPADSLEPPAVFGPELPFELLPQALRQRRAAPRGRNGDLQSPAAHDRGIKEIAVLRVIHGIAEDSSASSFAEYPPV